jgi:phage FluMu protein Com
MIIGEIKSDEKCTECGEWFGDHRRMGCKGMMFLAGWTVHVLAVISMKCPRCKEIRNTMNAKTHIEREGMCYSCMNNIDTSIHRGRL